VLVQYRLPVEGGLPGRLDQAERPPLVRRIGGDLLIAAGVDSVQSREGDPPVTALDLHPDRQAEVAVEMLLARLDDGDGDGDVAAPRHIPATLRVRASTGAL
jgi:DNA-binding LacI/PurR family transcriptional regulator